MTRPSSGVKPTVVSTERPPCTAASDALAPRRQVTSQAAPELMTEDAPACYAAIAAGNLCVVPYAVEATLEITQHADVSGTLPRDIAIIAGCVALALGGGAATLRRRTARGGAATLRRRTA